jgi:hypothetical protein
MNCPECGLQLWNYQPGTMRCENRHVVSVSTDTTADSPPNEKAPPVVVIARWHPAVWKVAAAGAAGGGIVGLLTGLLL